jgi:hypothetical protein
MLNLTTYYGFENVNNFLINNNKKEQSREGVGRVGGGASIFFYKLPVFIHTCI